MTQIRVKLLADVNSRLRGNDSIALQPKYLALVSASNLNMYLRYRRGSRRGKHTFRLDTNSLLKVDPDIQRGFLTTGELCQEDSKIEEIAKSLVGLSADNMRVFLGTLVWNVRESDVFEIITVERSGRPPEYELTINAPAIWLTDSAHRHFGICEALRMHGELGATSRFSPDLDFPVEIYNVDRQLESILFKELNSKQKKITAAKQQQVDNTSPLGRLKEAIRTYDAENDGFFVDNIEVNANTNERQTLMTMSVFVAAIKEMFGKTLIEQSAADESLRELCAKYFTESFYALRDRLRVTCTVAGVDAEVSPFANLHRELIRPVEDSLADEDDEDRIAAKLSAAREKAYVRNRLVREEDKINSNAFIKALASMLGRCRLMSNPYQVVDLIQSKLIAPQGGRYFQKSNPRMTAQQASGHSIATVKDDGTLNVQVQTHTLNEIKRLFVEELKLTFSRRLFVEDSGGDRHELKELRSEYVQVLKKEAATYVTLIVEFDVGDGVAPEEVDCKMRVEADLPDGAVWARAVKRVGERQLNADECVKVVGYEHDYYSSSISRYQAVFRLELPPFTPARTTSFSLKLSATVADEVGDEDVVKGVLTCQVE
ncbi:MAG: hypothetical protein NT171_19970 [Planctomycetota bacterium]|nr:hypothetical protein [Planctomycetota bacterium]